MTYRKIADHPQENCLIFLYLLGFLPIIGARSVKMSKSKPRIKSCPSPMTTNFRMPLHSLAMVWVWTAVVGMTPLCLAVVINVTPGVNNVVIQQVVYSINGSDVTQLTEAVGVNEASDTEVKITSIRVNNGGIVNLEYFNTAGASVLNVNSELASISGIGVFDNGATTPSNGGLAAYTAAVAATTTNSDLRNFNFYDFLSPAPPTPGIPDYDLLYVKAMQPDDYVLVSERWGNTFFEMTPLKADGTPYVGANVLRFGGAGGGGYTVYDWNSGYAAAGNTPSQAQAFSVASVSKFFEGTALTPGPVYGFRIDNDGEADTKILVLSDNPFEDNPNNPKLVPEPSAFLLCLGAGAVMMGSRRRRPADR
jgi:hypothetical protein